MRLDKLLNEVDVFDRPAEARHVEITSITEDSRTVQPGALFCCVVGASRDGHDLAADAVASGAAAVLVQREVAVNVPQIRVSDVRASVPHVAAAFYDHPSRHLRMAGVTGTNGKTTTTHLLAAILRSHRWRVGVIGTLGGPYTSPPAIELQRMLAEFREAKHNAAVMEVSSHALTQHRVDAVQFDVGIFTNLTQDHLDYHKTMSAYFDAKASLFDPGRVAKAVVNADDEWGVKLAERVAVPLFAYGLGDAVDLEMTASGSAFTWQGERIALPIVGRFNVYNALAAATAAKAMGVSVATIAHALSTVTAVPGRVERIDEGQPFTVLVDFAHTPDGLENVLLTARALAEQSGGRVRVVFGCGGDRDIEKRPHMGAAAEKFADDVIVTSDNPRSEDPEVIAGQAVAGMHDPDAVTVVLDRRTAIIQAISRAEPGDIVVIAGKGHEATQEVQGEKLPFDDRIVAADAIKGIAAW